MYGGIFGFLGCLATSLCGFTSWWWLLWGSLIGGFFELIARIGCTGEVSNVIEEMFDDIDIGDFGDSGGDYGRHGTA